MLEPLGLVAVPTSRLEALLRAVHRQTIEVPLSAAELARHGLQDDAEALLRHLRGLDGPAIHAVLVAVLAERRAQKAREQP